MSSIKISPNASGTGEFVIAAPNSNTNRTLTLPDNTGTILTSASTIAGTGVTDSASPFETSFGSGAGPVNTGTYNTFIGFDSGNDNTSGAYNTALGALALTKNTTAGDSTAVGAGALENSTGESNTALGAYSLNLNTSGTFNTAVGRLALYANTTGADNTAVGYAALDACTTGIDNVAVGSGALGASTTASYNVAIGKNALNSLTTSTANVVIGNTAGTNITGPGNTIIGEGAVTSAAGDSYSVLIGRANGNNITGKGASTTFISANGGASYNGGNTTTWTTTSDRRIKKNIVDNNEGIDIISQIQVRNFEYRLPEEVDGGLQPSDAVIKSGVQLGVIAQELQEVCPDCVRTESTGVLAVETDEIFWHMVNAIKDLKAINDAQATRIEILEAQNVAFETRLAALEVK